MDRKEYINKINYSLNKMDIGEYEEAINNLEIIFKSKLFRELKNKDKFFIKKRLSRLQLLLGKYKEGWQNFSYNWIKNTHKFTKILKQNSSIKYLLNLDEIKENDSVLIWNDGGLGDYIYQLRLLKYLKNIKYIKIYNSKMSHLFKDKEMLVSDAKDFKWHLPLNEIPRVMKYHPLKYKNFEYNYLIKPSTFHSNLSDFVGLTYKTETSESKSIKYELLENLFLSKTNINFLIIQKNLGNDEINFFAGFKNVQIVKDIDKNNIFEDTFSIVNSVKFTISVDTAVGHIAGYLQKKNYLLLNFLGHFYWGYNQEKVNDYPNHIIIRQKINGDWSSVIEKIIRLI